MPDDFKKKKVYGKGVNDLFPRHLLADPGSYRARVKHKKDGGYCSVCGHNPCGKLKK